MGRSCCVSRTARAACLVASSRRMIPGRSVREQQRLLTLRRLVIGRDDQRLLDPIAGVQEIAAGLELPAERQVCLRMPPSGRIVASCGGLLEELRRKLQSLEGALPLGGSWLGALQPVRCRKI